VKAAVLIAVAAAMAFAQAPAKHLTKADIESMMKELSTWGRWGKNDQKGTVNLITPEVRRRAVALVKEGVSVSLARDTDSTFHVKMSPPVDAQFNMDEQSVFFHGTAHTHFDALSHVFHGGQMYNGFPESAVKPNGTEKLAVTAYSEGFLTRACWSISRGCAVCHTSIPRQSLLLTISTRGRRRRVFISSQEMPSLFVLAAGLIWRRRGGGISGRTPRGLMRCVPGGSGKGTSPFSAATLPTMRRPRAFPA
jgi:hypothetical protein